MEWQLLGGLTDADLARVMAVTQRMVFDRGAVIFAAGDPGGTLHLLQHGHVAIRVPTAAGDAVTLTIATPGEVFGELALLRRSSIRSASAVALDCVCTYALSASAFRRLVGQRPDVERLLIGVLAERVNRLTRHLAEALYMPVDQRVLRRLVEVCHIYAVRGAETVVIPLTQEDLAGLVGTTRPTVNTVLRHLAEAGTVELRRGQIEVRDLPGLAAAAGIRAPAGAGASPSGHP